MNIHYTKCNDICCAYSIEAIQSLLLHFKKFDLVFSAFLKSNKFNVEYYKDLSNYIEKHVSDGRPLVAVHGICTDGGTSGAIIHHQIPEAIIIPLDYKILNDEHARSVLENLNWYGIVDLKPFNKKQANFWVDHHITSMNQTINAKRIRFDVDGDSGAYQLYLSNFLGAIPHKLVELAVMTRTTDTAGYIIGPPTKTYDSLSELEISITEGIEGRKQNEQRIWLLDDAWGSITTLKEQLELYHLLAKSGFMGIEKTLPRINKMRKKRSTAKKIAENMELKDVIMYSFEYNTVDDFTITRHLQELGAIVVASLSIGSDGVKISLRRNRNISKNLSDKIKLNKLASLMNGGGHEGASGARTDNVEEAITFIENWAAQLNLSAIYHKLN